MAVDLLQNLIHSAAPLLALVIFYSTVIVKMRSGPRRSWASGVAFGLVAVVGMMFPFQFVPGLVFDGRSVALSLAGFFGGPIAALIAALMAACFRAWLGGVGSAVGICVIVTASVLGVALRQVSARLGLAHGAALFLGLGLIVHLSALLWMTNLPGGLAGAVIDELSAPYLGVLTLSTWAFAHLLEMAESQEQTRNALTQSEHLLSEAQQAAHIGSYDLDVTSGRWTTTGMVDQILGIDADYPHTYAGWVRLLAPEQRDELIEYVRRVLKGEGEVANEYRIIRHDTGESRWVDVSGNVERDASGRALRIVGVMQDITERKQAEQAAMAGEIRFRTLVDAIPDLIWLKNPDGVYLACNPQFSRFFGASAQEIIGKTDFDFVDAELARFFVRKDREAMLAGGPSINEEWVTFADDGHRALLETIKTPLRGADGQLLGVLGVAREITARKQIEERLRHSEARHAEAQRVAQIGHWDLDHASGELHWSDQVFRIFGREPHVFHPTYATLLDVIHPDDREWLDKLFSDAVSKHKPYHVIHRILLPDGGVRHVEERGETGYAKDGTPQHSIGTVQDVTERVRIEQELAREIDTNRLMLDTMTDGYIRADETGRFLDVNATYCRLVGYEKRDLLGMNIADLKPPGTEAEVVQHLTMAGSDGRATFESRHLAKDGHPIDFDVRVSLIPGLDPPQFASFLRDVTQARRVEVHYRELVNRIPAGVFRYRMRPTGEGAFEFVSATFCGLLSVDAPAVLADPAIVFDRVHASDASLLDTLRQQARGRRSVGWDGRIDHAGGVRWIRVDAGASEEEGGDLVWHGIVTDITERERADEQLRLNSAVISSTAESILITDLDANIVSVNRAFCEITGYRAEEVLGRNARCLQSGRHDQSFFQAMWRALIEVGYWQGQVWNRRKSGEIYPEWLNISVVRNSAGQPTHYVGVASDISQLKRSEEQLNHLAHHDPLTGLPNRLLIGSRLQHALEQARRHGTGVAVLFLDLDRFKTVNDSLGHQVGDQLLVAVAERMRSVLREEDTLGRLGGDEFLVLLESTDTSMVAAKVAENVLAAVAQPFRLDSGYELYMQVSVGISVFPDDGDDAEILIRNADAAMFRAKEQGRNTFRFYTEALTKRASERLEIETQMRRGLAAGEFHVHYQPIHRLPDRALVGAEALVRWHRPDGAEISPDIFIPIAEDCGIIVELGAKVLASVCVDIRGWLDAGLELETLAVNLSAQQFRGAQLVRMLAGLMHEHAIPAGLLELEITERGLMDLGESTLAQLDAIKDLGVRLAIDDFGTGYSSLSYLKRMPVDKLKIDRSFISDLPDDANDAAIVRTIVAIARTLGLSVLAEGVETEAQLDVLAAEGCDQCQGFLFGKAMAADAYADLLRRRNGDNQEGGETR
jgi:diguanylate cyclase (GGDEF)-like protein/PAS domain S-box-containing protein